MFLLFSYIHTSQFAGQETREVEFCVQAHSQMHQRTIFIPYNRHSRCHVSSKWTTGKTEQGRGVGINILRREKSLRTSKANPTDHIRTGWRAKEQRGFKPCFINKTTKRAPARQQQSRSSKKQNSLTHTRLSPTTLCTKERRKEWLDERKNLHMLQNNKSKSLLRKNSSLAARGTDDFKGCARFEAWRTS